MNVNDLIIQLVDTLRENHQELILIRCTYLLGWINTKESRQILKNSLLHSSAIIREASVFVLGQIAEREVAYNLLLMLRDEDRRVSGMAATVIGWSGGDFHLDLMEEMGIFKNLTINTEVQSILFQIGSPRAISYLTKLGLLSQE